MGKYRENGDCAPDRRRNCARKPLFFQQAIEQIP